MDADNFSLWLKEKRDGRKLTQKQLADKLDVTKGRVSQWETGEIPPLDKLVLLAEALREDIREPLKALGVLTDETAEYTPDEREALTILRDFPDEVSEAALVFVRSLVQLQGGKAKRKLKGKRSATGTNQESKAS